MIEAWHFLPDDGRLYHGKDRRPVLVGQRRMARGPLKLCKNGMHASERALDALHYARGSLVCRVELSGEILTWDDKLCARYRTVTAMANVEEELHLFSCWCAETALKNAGVTEERCWNALTVKRLWVEGKASGAELDSAWNASFSAMYNSHPAWYSVRGGVDVARACRATLQVAANVAAWDAAGACRAASQAAANVAAWDAAGDAQNQELEARLFDALRKTAK